MNSEEMERHGASRLVQELALQLARSEERHRRELRRQRWMLAFLLLSVLSGFYLLQGEAGGAAAREAVAAAAAPGGGEKARKREQLLQQMPAEQRERLLRFEQEARWISQYMQTWDPGMEGAVVALMLKEMAESMRAVPQMLEQMKVMNGYMQSLPVMTAEMQRMSANIAAMALYMSVMNRNMDDTMGRMGRMMPW